MGHEESNQTKTNKTVHHKQNINIMKKKSILHISGKIIQEASANYSGIEYKLFMWMH